VPTNRRRRPRTSRGDKPLPKALRVYLEIGAFPPAGDPAAWEVIHKTAAAGEGLRASWTDWRDTIMAGWIKANPGRRPFAWWLFDSPDSPAPRRQLAGIGPPSLESEASYLQRHGQLSPAEAKRLTPADFAPVRVVVTADTQKEEKI
jgi:hypothetical protein